MPKILNPMCLSRSKRDIFFKQLERNPNISFVCRKIGIGSRTIGHWAERDPKFRARMHRAIEKGIKFQEIRAWKRAKKSLNDIPIWELARSLAGSDLELKDDVSESHSSP